MPIERREVSVSQLSELLGIAPERFIGIVRLNSSTVTLLLEPEDETPADD